MKLTVTEIQRFCMHDGPGVRTTVFLKGCPLRCKWCHNPETQNAQKELLFYANKCIGCGACVAVCPNDVHELTDGATNCLTDVPDCLTNCLTDSSTDSSTDSETTATTDFHILDRSKCVACGKCAEACPTKALELCGNDYEINELVDMLEKDRAFYGNDGGVTLSGGEPLIHGAEVVALLKECKNRGLHTAIETCGYFDQSILAEVVRYTDLFLWDIKDTNDTRHKEFTGVSNEKILSNLQMADRLGAKIRLRGIIVNGVNTDETHYQKVAKIACTLANCVGVEFFPYHAYGGSKATFLGVPDNGVKEWIPAEEQIEMAKSSVDEAHSK